MKFYIEGSRDGEFPNHLAITVGINKHLMVVANVHIDCYMSDHPIEERHERLCIQWPEDPRYVPGGDQ